MLLTVPIVLLAGCESSQEKSARLKKQAGHAIAEKAKVVGHQTNLVSVTPDVVLRSKDRGAAVVTIRNKGSKTLARLPIGITVLSPGGTKLFGNDVPGLQASLIEVPVIEPHETFTWVNDQVNISGKPARLKAVVGAPKSRPGRIPQLTVSKLSLHEDPVSGTAAEGHVTNESRLTQVNLVLFGVARRGRKIVAAGRALIPKLKPGRRAKFSIFWVGNPRGAQLDVSAPPTVLG